MFGVAGVLAGILLAAVGIFLVIFFPSVSEHQSGDFAVGGIVLGIVFLITGAALIFL